MPQAAKKHTPFKIKKNLNISSRRYAHLYDRRWQKARKAFLSNNPLCVQCERQGKAILAKVVDHKKPHKGSYILFWDPSNWQSMCKPCHDHKTATEDGGFGNQLIINEV